jgi:anti-sigma regulatory factor (Ser/Thr protein kinase)
VAQRQKSLVIRQFITDYVTANPTDIGALTAKQFNISRQAVSHHMKWLVNHGVLRKSGNTTGRTYELIPTGQLQKTYELAGLKEDVVWLEDIKPLLGDAPENVSAICSIGFTEMLNNAIDHSEAASVSVDVLTTAATVAINIRDRGVGIFKKIRTACGLRDERDAILELGKGRLTTSPEAHTGYGVYFTSRMVDIFTMASGKLFFAHIQPDDDWLMELDRDPVEGTSVELIVSKHTDRSATDVYNQFCESPDSNMGFSKTHVPIALAQYGNEHLVSRSQAKRVLSRFDNFSEVLLDFRGVDFIGQAFADEIFRVFPANYPGIKIGYRNAGPQVAGMIRLAQVNKPDPQRRIFTK